MTKRILAQAYPAASVLTDLYVVPARQQCNIINLIITNQSNLPSTFSLAFCELGIPTIPKMYLFKNTDILANESINLDVNVVFNQKDVIRVESGNGLTSFNLLGQEYSAMP